MTKNEIYNIVKEFVVNEFRNEMEKIKYIEKLFDLEEDNRSKAKIPQKIYSEKILSIRKKVMDDLEKYKTSSEYISLEKYDRVNKSFLEECSNIENKDLAILFTQYLTLEGKGNANLIKQYNWFEAKYYILFEWECIYCKSKNVIKSINKTTKNLSEIPCSNCKLVPSSRAYYKKEFKEGFFNKLTFSDLDNKLASIYQKIKEQKFSKKSEETVIEWDKNDKYLIYQKNRNKLPYKIKEALNIYYNLPNKVSLEEDFQKVFSSISSSELEKYGLIKRVYRELSDYEIAKELVNKDLLFSLKLLDDFHFTTLRKSLNDTHTYLDHYLSNKKNVEFYIEDIEFNNICYIDTTVYLKSYLNEYFFETQEINIINEKSKINIFQSEDQRDTYFKLRHSYDEKHIVMPNYPIIKLINFETKEYEDIFSKIDLTYLKNAYFSYIIATTDGDLVKVYNLIKGYYHSKPNYEYKDNLKKQLCYILNIEYEEIFD